MNATKRNKSMDFLKVISQQLPRFTMVLPQQIENKQRKRQKLHMKNKS